MVQLSLLILLPFLIFLQLLDDSRSGNNEHPTSGEVLNAPPIIDQSILVTDNIFKHMNKISLQLMTFH